MQNHKALVTALVHCTVSCLVCCTAVTTATDTFLCVTDFSTVVAARGLWTLIVVGIENENAECSRFFASCQNFWTATAFGPLIWTGAGLVTVFSPVAFLVTAIFS